MQLKNRTMICKNGNPELKSGARVCAIYIYVYINVYINSTRTTKTLETLAPDCSSGLPFLQIMIRFFSCINCSRIRAIIRRKHRYPRDPENKIGTLVALLSGVYTSNLFNDLDFYLGQILSLYEAKYLGQIFSQTFCFIEGKYLAQIKFQIV